MYSLSFPRARRAAGAAVVAVTAAIAAGAAGLVVAPAEASTFAPAAHSASAARAAHSANAARAELQRDADAMRDLGVTGVQARLVNKSGRHVVATSGVARIGTRRPVPADGHFRIGSTNKTFVATVALQLVGEGRLNLNDRVDKHLPGLLRGKGIDGRTITVRHLMQHTSGLADAYTVIDSAAGFRKHRYDTQTAKQLVKRTLKLPALAKPGKRFAYSNTGYVLVGMIIEKITDRPWHVEVKNRILRPLGMRDTIFPNGKPKLPNPHARGYAIFPDADKPVDVTEASINQDASGGLVSTNTDLSRFFRALLSGRLLRPAELAQMKRTVPMNDGNAQQMFPGARYGLGLMSHPRSCGGVFWGHGGSDLGYMTLEAVSDNGRHSVMMSGSGPLMTTPDGAVKLGKAGAKLLDNAMCP